MQLVYVEYIQMAIYEQVQFSSVLHKNSLLKISQKVSQEQGFNQDTWMLTVKPIYKL